MYHDQVLTPFKALFEFDAINVTMGLPFLRVTPDHGPNKKMVGKNISSPISLIKALKFWIKIDYSKKSLGQNFLIDRNIINKILNTVDIENKSILEIGPGTEASQKKF